MLKKLLFIKLGGSLISDKTKINKSRNDKFVKLCRQIEEIQKDNFLLIFTGAGGFGHPIAEKYKNNLLKGKKEIKDACKKLNNIIVSALIETGLKATSIEPNKVAEYERGKLVALKSSNVVSLLDKNVIPVFHADLVDDKKLGVSILSMDKFLADTAIYFKNHGFMIEKAIFLGNTPVTTPGVGDRHGRVVQRITKKDFFKIKDIFYNTVGTDVSGGMKYKVEQSLRLANEGIKSYITDDLFKKGTLVS